MAILKQGLKITVSVLYGTRRRNKSAEKLTARLSAARKVRARNPFIVATVRK
jgi:hypothetical protein